MNDRKLRILQVGTQLGVGGITRHILSLTQWLRENGHEVTLAGTADVWVSHDIEDRFLDLPIRLVAGDGGNVLVRLFYTAVAAAKLRRWLRRNPVDIIHCHDSAPALVALVARIGMKTPVAVTYHGSEPERIPLFGRIASRCDLVVTPSHKSADDLREIGGVRQDRLKVIGLGHSPMPDYDPDEVQRLRQKLLGDGTHLIVTLARLTHQKGIDILIDCVARLKESHPGFRFVVAGDGPDTEKLHKMARGRSVDSHLSFAGRTETPHLYLQAADLFLLTSRWEALPISIVESFQARTPTVATACSGVVELIDDQVGAVVPIGDVDAICAAVVDILSDEARRADMGKAAKARSTEDRFQPDWVHAQFEKTYLALAGGAAQAKIQS